MKLEGKVAIVTGAARGIGRATALELARNGADVVVNDLPAVDAAAAVVQEIEALGRRALFFPGDVADRQRDQEMIETAIRELGRVDILVHNAGISAAGSDVALTNASTDPAVVMIVAAPPPARTGDG